MNLHDRDITRKAFQEGEASGIEKGIFQGAKQTKIETAKNMIQKNLNFELIEECTSLPLEKIQQLAKELQQSN
jgi:predicted transposase/invertase (TIGR01784 family)